MLQHAFKEWAVVCEALASGRQALILRKGGVDEDFTVAQRRFWLFPTYTHQQQAGIREDARALLAKAEAERPSADAVRLSHWAEVASAYRVHELLPAHMLAHLHIWSDATVERRFGYREPGLTVLVVRAHRAADAYEIPMHPAYEGCKSWVELAEPLETAGSVPVLGDAAFRDVQRSVDLLLTPTALA